MSEKFRNIPEHKHTHSLYVHCLKCKSFGVPQPSDFIEAVECGNCGSMDTVKYYPACCILADREGSEKPIIDFEDVSEDTHEPFDGVTFTAPETGKYVFGEATVYMESGEIRKYPVKCNKKE